MILLAESGSTKTDWRLINKGKEIGNFLSIGINPYYLSAEQINAEISLLKSKLEPVMLVKEVYFYGTGINTVEKEQVLIEAFKENFGKAVQVEVFSDVVAAGRALFGPKEGIACILGTGSNSAYFNLGEIKNQVPPLGFWLGDEGSGGHLGKTLILSYLHKEMPEEIRSVFEKDYGKLTRYDVFDFAYNKDSPNTQFAKFAIFLKENEENAFITQLIENSLEKFIHLYVKKYDNSSSVPVGFVGSIAFYFKKHLIKVCKKNNLNLGLIIEKPIDNLVNLYL